MPITKQAAKKLRHDRIRTKQNQKIHDTYRPLVKKARKSATQKSLSTAFSAIDKAVKIHAIHKNKAARLKARLAKRLKQK